jgi:hypothetical protein
MKKLMTILGSFLFASVILTSCGGGIESDAEKGCEMICEAAEVANNLLESPTDADLLKEAADLGEKMQEFGDELDKKYKDDKEGEKELKKLMSNCKCD